MSTKIIRSIFAFAVCFILFLPIFLYIGTVVANIGTDTAPTLPTIGTVAYSNGGYTFSSGSIFAPCGTILNSLRGTPFATAIDSLHTFTSDFGFSDYASFGICYAAFSALAFSLITLLTGILLFPIKIFERF